MKAYNDPTADKAIANLRYYRPLTYLCFPYERKKEKVKGYCRFAVEKNYTPIVAQLMYPAVYPEFRGDTTQRRLAMEMRLELVQRCSELWVIGDRLTQDMMKEINRAAEQRLPVRYFTDELTEVRRC